eukprot:455053_1
MYIIMLIIITILSIITTWNNIFAQGDNTRTPFDADQYYKNTFGTTIATIATQNENNYITETCKKVDGCESIVDNCGCIIGLTYIYTEQSTSREKWTWMSYFPYDFANDFTNWAPSKPCDACTKWSFIRDKNQIYHQADSCGNTSILKYVDII